jgi:hypothetical protein
MMRVMSWLLGFGRFWYRFIIGDDWTVAASLAIGLAVTALLHTARFPAWWVIPLIVIVMLRVSVQRTKRPKNQRAARRNQ